MKIVVISDTHLRRKGEEKLLPGGLLDELERADLIVHCGDIEEAFLIDEMEKYAPVKAVHGNMDSPEVREMLPEKEVMEVSGIKIGIIHGSGPPYGIKERILSAFGGEELHVILFGHTHLAEKREKDGIIFLNPGSPTDKKFAPYNSFGLLHIDTEKEKRGIKAEIIRV